MDMDNMKKIIGDAIEKAVADKAAKLIARDYGETLMELADE